jgi:segregation and condensation protein A
MSGIIAAMDLDIASHQTRAYVVSTAVFAGPLDLLLHLIERAELDITRLALAQVTNQYLAHLRQLTESSAEEVSAFLVIAAKLIQIKSEALLPRPPQRATGEEDPGEALARQLLVYKRFKEISLLLEERETAGLHTYLRLAPPPKVETHLDLSGISLEDLVAAARAVFLSKPNQIELGSVVAPPRITIREKISLIIGALKQFGRSTFRRLLSTRPRRLDIVVTFLAMLELIKRRTVQARQEQLFGEIEIEPTGLLNGEDNFELEFGE